MRRLLVVLVAAGALMLSAGIGLLAADWPFLHRLWPLPADKAQWRVALRTPVEGLDGGGSAFFPVATPDERTIDAGALAMTLASMASPTIFGRLDPGGARRVRWLLAMACLAALLVGVMGLVRIAWADVALAIAYGLLSGYGVLQYGYVRDAYPEAMRGRALSLFTMAMFLGISLMQWASGLAASLAPHFGGEPFSAALLTMSAMLLAGALAFWKLPRAGA